MTKEVQKESNDQVNNPLSVGLGELCVGSEPNTVLAAFALGSCIAICAHDPIAKVGALAHVVLPNAPAFSRLNNGDNPPGKYADRALPEMISRLEKLGAVRERLVFKLVGGAAVLSGANMLGNATNVLPGRLDVGRRNVQGVLNALYSAGFFPVAADLGGQAGRTVYFWPGNGKMRVRTVRGEEREY
jgi:chemotaxis protein CheD